MALRVAAAEDAEKNFSLASRCDIRSREQGPTAHNPSRQWVRGVGKVVPKKWVLRGKQRPVIGRGESKIMPGQASGARKQGNSSTTKLLNKQTNMTGRDEAVSKDEVTRSFVDYKKKLEFLAY